MFDYNWYLKNNFVVPGIKKHGLKVFTTFSCGGGSSMGYKLAGYDVIGANDIDERMKNAYTRNLHPRLYYKMPIKEMLTAELPDEMYDLDVLDGSPPCSTFSTTGKREKNWKKNKKFREGQETQVLSDLFFDWIALVDKLKPRIAIAENVKGMLIGNAKAYTQKIQKELEKIGYDVQIFLFNASTMGVPQKRERVFFICRRRDLNLPSLSFSFDQEKIPFQLVSSQASKIQGDLKEDLTDLYLEYWKKAKPGKPVGKFASCKKLDGLKTANTFHTSLHYHHEEARPLSKNELCLCGSFPLDYDFSEKSLKDIIYLIGMSVPPVMMANVAHQVFLQLFDK